MSQPISEQFPARRHEDSELSIEGSPVYYTKDIQPDNMDHSQKSSREEIIHRKVEKMSKKSHFFINQTVESLNYIGISNQLELAWQKTRTFGKLMREDCLRIILFIMAGVITAVINVAMELFIHVIGYYKYAWFSSSITKRFEKSVQDFLIVSVSRFLTVMLPIMIGTALVVYIAPWAAGGGVAQCIAYLNGIRVPKILSVRGLWVKFLSTICTCVSGLAGGKEGPAMHFGAIVGGGLPSLLPWLKFKSDQERRDLASAGFGAGIAVVFGAPIGGMLLALEEAVSFWDIGLMWKMYLCCIVCYAVGSIDYSLLFHVEVRLNNPELSTLGSISQSVTSYELFELVFFAVQAVFAGLLGALLIKLHIYVAIVRQKYVNTNSRKLLLSFVASITVTVLHLGSILCFRYCSVMTQEERDRIHNDTLLIHAHQLYCKSGEHSDMSLMFEQPQSDLLRSFFGTEAFKMKSLLWFSFTYFFLLCLTWSLTLSYGVFIPQIIFGAAWGKLFGTFIHYHFPKAEWAQPAKYSYIGAAAQLSATVGKTFSILMIMIEASGSINLAFPLMMVVIITKVVVSFFVVPIYHAQMLLQGLPFLFAKPPPLSLDVTSEDIMSQTPLVTIPHLPSVGKIIDIIKMTTHNGFPVVDRSKEVHLVGLILRQQLLVLLKYKAYKFPPPKTVKEKCECHRIYSKLARSHLNEQEILNGIKPKYYDSILDLTPYYDAFPATVTASTPAVKAYSLFRNMALRHLVVVSALEPVGIITRKDLAKFHTFANFFRMGVKEMLVKS